MVHVITEQHTLSFLAELDGVIIEVNVIVRLMAVLVAILAKLCIRSGRSIR